MALNTTNLGENLKKYGFNFYSGVPCSFLKSLINYGINECEFIMAANEGDAVAICAGANLAGKKAVVFMQNSGLTNAVSPLTSLNNTFKIPVLGFVSLRGGEGIVDEPQHDLMGVITGKLLDDMNVKWEYLSDDEAEVAEQLKRANAVIDNKETFFFVVKKGTLGAVELLPQDIDITTERELVISDKENEVPTREMALEAINAVRTDETLIVTTTGMTGRELFEVEDNHMNLYMVGSMGCASSISLGYSNAVDLPTITIDGDGALLMRLGSLATNGTYGKSNKLHILLDNSTHDSTGGQFTVSPNVDFVTIASSCGYNRAVKAATVEELKQEVANWYKNPKLTFLYLKTEKGSKKGVGRPTIKPFEVADRVIAKVKELV